MISNFCNGENIPPHPSPSPLCNGKEHGKIVELGFIKALKQNVAWRLVITQGNAIRGFYERRVLLGMLAGQQAS